MHRCRGAQALGKGRLDLRKGPHNPRVEATMGEVCLGSTELTRFPPRAGPAGEGGPALGVHGFEDRRGALGGSPA